MEKTKTPTELYEECMAEWTATLEAQIDKAGGNHNCLVCNSNEWTMMVGVDQHGKLDGYGLPYFSDLSVSGYIPTMTVACKKCGFVKQHVFRLKRVDSDE